MVYRVLVVDDEPAVRHVLSVLIEIDPQLTLAGTAGDGVEALGAVERSCPDAVICDARMPIMGGLEVLPKIREVCPDSVLVLYSSDPDATRCAVAVGADDAVEKSEDPTSLLEKVVQLVDQRAGGRG